MIGKQERIGKGLFYFPRNSSMSSSTLPIPAIPKLSTNTLDLMDELRDYRFYADDMLHPSPLAIDYIWQRFIENFLSTDTSAILKEWGDIQKAINHKPFQPDSEAYKRFILQTLLKMERISEKIPSFDIRKEIEIVKSKLK